MKKIKNIILSLLITYTTGIVSGQYNDTLKINYFNQQPVGKQPAVFSPDFISRNGWLVQNCCFSPDGKEFIFCITTPDWSTKASCLMYTKYDGSKWLEPDTLLTNVENPMFSNDGKYISFISEKRNNSDTVNFWKIERNGNGWKTPVAFEWPINSSQSGTTEIAEAKNGNIYFSSAPANGSTDLFATKKTNSGYSAAENLGSEINSDTEDRCLFVAPDESYLLFNSWRLNINNHNLFVTFRKKDNTWATPKSIGLTKNTTTFGCMHPYITPDGKYLIYSYRDDVNATSAKLYWVSASILDSIKKLNSAPYVTKDIPNAIGHVGKDLSIKIASGTFSDDDEDDVLTYSVDIMGNALPEWLTFNKTTLTFSGIPSKEQTLQITVRASDKSKASVSNQFNLDIEKSTGIQASKEADFQYSVFNNCLHIRFIENGGRVEVYDLNGKIVYKKIFNGNNELKTDPLKPGVYIISIKYSSGEKNKKVIIQ